MDHRRSGVEKALVFHSAGTPSVTSSSELTLVAKSHRHIYPGPARARGIKTIARSAPHDPDSARDLRSYGLAPHAGRSGCVHKQSPTGCLRTTRGSAAGFVAIRRARSPLLAGCRALW